MANLSREYRKGARRTIRPAPYFFGLVIHCMAVVEIEDYPQRSHRSSVEEIETGT